MKNEKHTIQIIIMRRKEVTSVLALHGQQPVLISKFRMDI